MFQVGLLEKVKRACVVKDLNPNGLLEVCGWILREEQCRLVRVLFP